MKQNGSKILSLNKVTVFSGSVSEKSFAKVKNITGKKILSIDHLTLEAGNSLFVKGQPAVGKTVLLKIIQQRPTADEAILKYPPKKSSSNTQPPLLLNFNPPVINQFNIIRNILLPISNPTFRLQGKVIELLHKYGLDHKMKECVAVLSHSELLKLQLVRALILLPALLLVDDIDLIAGKTGKDNVWFALNKILQDGGSVVASGTEHIPGFDRYYEIIPGGSVVKSNNI